MSYLKEGSLIYPHIFNAYIITSKRGQLGVLVHVFNHSGGRRHISLSSRPAWSTKVVQDSQRCLQKPKIKKQKRQAECQLLCLNITNSKYVQSLTLCLYFNILQGFYIIDCVTSKHGGDGVCGRDGLLNLWNAEGRIALI